VYGVAKNICLAIGQQYSEEMSLPDLTKTIGLLFMALLVGLVKWQLIERI
jgi:hypothetical protein